LECLRNEASQATPVLSTRADAGAGIWFYRQSCPETDKFARFRDPRFGPASLLSAATGTPVTPGVEISAVLGFSAVKTAMGAARAEMTPTVAACSVSPSAPSPSLLRHGV